QPAHLTGFVIVVDVQRQIAGLLAADGAHPTLRFEHRVVLLNREPVLPLQMRLAVSDGLAARCRVLTLTRGIAIGVRALPGNDSFNFAVTVLLVPSLAASGGARFALRPQTVTGGAVVVKVGGGLFGSAVFAALHSPQGTARMRQRPKI